MNDPNSPCAKRRRADAPQVVNNINTLNAYFGAATGPAATPEDTRPPNLFPEDERQHNAYVPYHGRTRPYRVSHATCDGQLKAGCTHCKSNYKDMVQFAPPECNNNGRRRPKFFEALQAYSVAWDERDLEAARAARAKVEELRYGKYPPCQESSGNLSPAVKACKDEYVRMRRAACLKNNGCANPDCAERGEQAWCVLHGNHLHTRKEEDDALRKTRMLSDYPWWSGHGGVEAMRAEEAKGMQWICGFCHQLEPTTTAANRCQDPWAEHEDGTSVMPDGKRGGLCLCDSLCF